MTAVFNLFGDEWEPLHIRSGAKLIYIGEIRDAAVATSASAGLIHPQGRSGSALGVSVLAATCMTADALTKPCMLEPQRAEEMAQRFGARVLRAE